jgi:transcription elongation factor GreB
LGRPQLTGHGQEIAVAVQCRAFYDGAMSKAVTEEIDSGEDDADADPADALPAETKNYVTPSGHAALRDELRRLLQDERPKVVETVRWAASNGDRSENADYTYGKRRLREIDRRVHYLTRRLDSAVPVDPKQQQRLTQVFFGATVSYAKADGSAHVVTLVGLDEADFSRGLISWLSPLAQALMKARVGDTVQVRTPMGIEEIKVISLRYE